jgi:hypothetical protein
MLSLSRRDPEVENRMREFPSFLTCSWLLEVIMKTRPLAVMVLAVWVLNSPLSFAQKSDSTESVPDYEISKEIKLKGVIDEARDRVCSISGSMGSHLTVKIGDKIYDVHRSR